MVTAAGQALLDAFDRIVVINLASRKDRLREISEQLGRLGLSFDHSKLFRFDACRFDKPAGFPTTGTRGCFHSHMGVWQEALARGDGSVLLLEDDLDLASDIEARLPPALAQLAASDWSIFYGAVLEWESAQAPTTPIAMAQSDEPILGGHFIAMRGAALAGIGRYLSSIAQRPAGSPEGGPMHVDGAYGWFRKANPHLTTKIAVPDLGFQRSSRTDIHALGIKDRLPIIRQAVEMVRRLRRRLR